MPGTINVLNRAVSLDTAPKFEAFTGVRLWYDDDQYFFAGDETGRVLEADNPWATQAMADEVLASVSGYTYQPFEAGSALLDPAAELGDGVNVGGVYGPLASVTTRFDAMCSADISAPADEEIDHEYPYLSPAEREYKRNKARTYSLISKTAEEILLEVHKLQTNTELSLEALEKSFGEDLDGLEKAFGEDLDGLSKTFTETLKQYSTITQTAEKIELAVTTSKEYTDTKTGEVVASLSKYSTITQTDSKISTAVSTSKEYTDAKINDLSNEFGTDLSALANAVNVTLQKYSTIEQTDSKIATSVNTSKEYTNSKTGDVIASLSKYSTIEQTDSKISTSVSTSKQYTDQKTGEITTALKNYSTITQTDSKISLAVTGLINESQANSLISQAMDKIELSVSSANGSTSLKLTSNGVEIDSDTVELSVNALNIYGTINADKLNLTGAITFGDLDRDTQSQINNRGISASRAKTIITEELVSSPVIDGGNVISRTAFHLVPYGIESDTGNEVEFPCGSMGVAFGEDAAGETTYGVALASAETGTDAYGYITCASVGHYVIVTNKGVRLQAGENNITVTENGAFYNGVEIGSGVGEGVTITPVWG